MTDKEKIERLMKEKGLANGEFADKVGITAGSLSHILNGRSNPSLTVLRGVVKAFPDVNPLWLYSDDEEMYLKVAPQVVSEVDEDGNEVVGVLEGILDPETGANSFDFTPIEGSSGSQSSASRPASPSKGRGQVQPAPSADYSELLNLSRSILSEIQRPQRKVVEVRIFFDDGTFETFASR